MAIEERAGSPAAGWIRRSIGIVVGLGGYACALTVLYLSMRAVLDVGGACVSGHSAYQVATPCPKGIAGLTIGSVLGGIAAALIYAVSLVPGGPRFVALLWPALFISLGWNFIDYGYEPPGGDGFVWGWLVSGVIFLLMGGIPLLLVLTARRLGTLVWGDDGPAGWGSVVPIAPFRPAGDGLPVLEWLGPAPSPSDDPSSVSVNGAAPVPAELDGTEVSSDVVSRLERLADLRRRGVLTSAEFEAAKREVIEGR